MSCPGNDTKYRYLIGFGSMFSRTDNKASISQIISSYSDLDTYKIEGFYHAEDAVGAYEISNAPEQTGAFSLLVERTGAWGSGVKQTYSNRYDETWVRTSNMSSPLNSWTPWVKMAIVESPLKNTFVNHGDIDNANGSFFKDQFGQITISLSSSKALDIVHHDVLAVLPFGYYTAGYKWFPAICINSLGDSIGACGVYIQDDAIIACQPLAGTRMIAAQICYYL